MKKHSPLVGTSHRRPVPIPTLRALFLVIPLVFAQACSENGPPVGPDVEPTLFPDRLSELDLSAQQPFAPQYVLWTNGSAKDRGVAILENGRIDATDSRFWDFPDGIRFTKTFSYRTQVDPGTDTKIETRIIWKVDGEWETAAYLWRADQSDADLLDGSSRTNVPVTTAGGDSFTHVIPSSADCQACHGSRSTFILGFREFQLNYPVQAVNQLTRFHGLGFFASPPPEDPLNLDDADPQTAEVLGYVEANCAHCHNSEAIAIPDFSLDVFLQNTVNVLASNGATLITPGEPEESEVFLRFRDMVMPPLGVNLIDQDMVDSVEDWILSHDFGGGP